MVKKVINNKAGASLKEEKPEFSKLISKDPIKSKKRKEPKKKKMTAREREELLIENFVGLQHAMTNLSIKFGTLSDNISELLRVFEGAAKTFAQGGKVDDSDLLKKINSLLDQNKTIAKGLVLMESNLRGRSAQPNEKELPIQRPKPLPGL
jgi:hypothetical protein|tara:strand:+ start:95 stop:547 length:453 start_codon:yes stop_codon:yes gene_type:complete